MSSTIKVVPQRVVVGPRGMPAIERGYTEIGGVRIYDDMVIVGERGLPAISEGWTEIAPHTLVNGG